MDGRPASFRKPTISLTEGEHSHMEANQEAQSAQTADMRETLEDLKALRDALERQRDAYAGLLEAVRRRGTSVAEISAALGISRTAVYKQLGRKEQTR